MISVFPAVERASEQNVVPKSITATLPSVFRKRLASGYLCCRAAREMRLALCGHLPSPELIRTCNYQ